MQCSRALFGLPVAISLALAPSPASAQARYRVVTDSAWFYQTPAGKRLAVVARTALVSAGAPEGAFVPVTLDGWIFETSLGPSPKPEFQIAVAKPGGENLRATPRGDLIATLIKGFGLNKTGQQGRWVHVTRDGYMRQADLTPLIGIVATRTAAGDSDSTRAAVPVPVHPPDSAAVDASRVAATRRTTVYRTPDGAPAATIAGDTPLRVLSKSGDWSRVELEGWVRSSDLAVAPAGALVGLSAAELRAEPQRYVGQVLNWTLQFIAIEKADDLRPEIPNGATYLLAQGPVPERGFVYVVVPDAKVNGLSTLPPLATIRITARVRAGKSRYLGNPVVDLLTLEVEP